MDHPHQAQPPVPTAVNASHNILFVSSEVYPLSKTGGLGDVAGSLPIALQSLGHPVTVLTPAYRETWQHLEDRTLRLLWHGELHGQRVRLVRTQLGGSRVRLLLLDCPVLFDRDGGPYLDADGLEWPDNALRFLLLSRVAAAIALGNLGAEAPADILHCNDWQSAMAAALVADEVSRPATVFTIHNLAYQGLFPGPSLQELGLDSRYWDADALEFHGQLSFIKGGLVYADQLTTVSPRYTEEICTEPFGCGLSGLLSHRREQLHGIINGIDVRAWNPGNDPFIAASYSWRKLDGKAENRLQLCRHLGLTVPTDAPVMGFIGRLIEQKGVDLLIQNIPWLVARGCSVAILGSGENHFEAALRNLADTHQGKVAAKIGYDEPLAHRIEAGADLFLMPSRFEPCGLNQLFSLRYGTPPVVHATGGLADTVLDADTHDRHQGNGFVFHEADVQSFRAALERALSAYQQPALWQNLQRNGMRRDASWRQSAASYVDIYRQALRQRDSQSHSRMRSIRSQTRFE